MARYRIFIVLTSIMVLVLITMILFFRSQLPSIHEQHIQAKKKLAGRLELTDLAIWTEARYTRHPSQADLFSPFQDFPGSLDHFPAGSVVAPPPVSR